MGWSTNYSNRKKTLKKLSFELFQEERDYSIIRLRIAVSLLYACTLQSSTEPIIFILSYWSRTVERSSTWPTVYIPTIFDLDRYTAGVIWHFPVSALLDLSAAFDLVDNGIMQQCLWSSCGFDGPALVWFWLYLFGESQAVRQAVTRYSCIIWRFSRVCSQGNPVSDVHLTCAFNSF